MVELSDMAAVIATAKQAAGFVKVTPGVVWLASAREGTGEALALERFEDVPFRKRGTVTVFDVDSFNAVLSANHEAGHSAVYVDRDLTNPRIVAVLNGTGSEGPGWQDHRCELVFRQTPQWAKWRAVDGKLLAQDAFAQFIEDNRADVETPSGADMVEIAANLSVARKVAHRSNIKLLSGAVEFEFSEDLDAKVGGAKNLAIPETFMLALKPYQGQPAFRVPARFRYRLGEGGVVTMGLRLERIEDLMEQVLDLVVAKIQRIDNVPVLEGVAPGPVVPQQ